MLNATFYVIFKQCERDCFKRESRLLQIVTGYVKCPNNQLQDVPTIFPRFVGTNVIFHPRSKFKNHPFILGQNSKITPCFIWSILCKRSSHRSQTFLSVRTLYLAYPKLGGSPCRSYILSIWLCSCYSPIARFF